MAYAGDRGPGASRPTLRGILKKTGSSVSQDGVHANMYSTTEELRAAMQHIVPDPESLLSRAAPRRSSSQTRKKTSISSISQCQSCGKQMEEYESIILKNCQRHEVCEECVNITIGDSTRYNIYPVCPVDNCDALLTSNEIKRYYSGNHIEFPEEPVASMSDDSGSESNHEPEKTPKSSTQDDSEDFVDQAATVKAATVRAATTKARCDTCNRLVPGSDYLDIRKCKKKHMICFDCIRATMKVSRTLVRCPGYRECKSMMSRDEVMQVKYDTTHEDTSKNKELKFKTGNSRSTLIYPDGLPLGDLWPVLKDTQCSKCNCDIGVMNGVVLKQCNTHNVCANCIAETMATNKNPVPCPMFRSCRAVMSNEEVKAFHSRFG